MSNLTHTDLDNKASHVVYRATSPSGKSYVGKTTKSFIRRKNKHISEANNGSDTPFHRAIRKYGENMKWEILEKCDDDKLLRDRECYYISKYNTYRDGYNCTLGGEGHSGFKQSEETKRKRGKAISKALTGKKLSKQHKEALSKAHIGLPSNMLGKKHSKETREKISQLQNHKKRAVICIETSKRFESITKAARDMNISKANLQKHLSSNPKYKSYKSISGYTFRFEGVKYE